MYGDMSTSKAADKRFVKTLFIRMRQRPKNRNGIKSIAFLKNDTGTGLLKTFWTFPRCLFFFYLQPSPVFLTRFIILLWYNLPPLFSSFFLALFFPSLSLCQLVSGGINVQGPHPSQTTAWILCCSVQSSALQFCHSEHRLFGGRMRTPPPPSSEWYLPDIEVIDRDFLMGWVIPYLLFKN